MSCYTGRAEIMLPDVLQQAFTSFLQEVQHLYKPKGVSVMT